MTWIHELNRERLPLPTLDVDARIYQVASEMTIAVTGAHGYIGTLTCQLLAELGAKVIPLDLPEYDLLKPRAAAWADLPLAEIDAIIHLAAHKEAIMGEELPGEVADLNVRGTQFITELGVPVVLASTCKAVDPCTAYGASKLIAERIVLNAGGCVVRLVNVIGSSRSVVPIWDAVPKDEPLPVTHCERMWITPEEAAGLMAMGPACMGQRIVPDVPPPEPVAVLALRLHPERSQTFIPLRRGDRAIEKLVGDNEALMPADSGIRRILDPWELDQMRAGLETPLPPHMDAAPLEKMPGCGLKWGPVTMYAEHAEDLPSGASSHRPEWSSIVSGSVTDDLPSGASHRPDNHAGYEVIDGVPTIPAAPRLAEDSPVVNMGGEPLDGEPTGEWPDDDDDLGGDAA